MKSPSSEPRLFADLTPPPGGLFRLRRHLREGMPRRPRRLLLPMALAGGAVTALVVAFVLRAPPRTLGETEVWSAPEAPAVTVDGATLALEPLAGGALFVWLPPR